MSKVFKLDESVEKSVKKLLTFLLNKGRIRGALVLQKTDGNSAVAYSLITDADALASACPLCPLMPSNAASVLSRLTLQESLPEPLAVVLRPCELRGFIELVKHGQGSLDKFLFISSVCGGVYPLKMVQVDGSVGEKLPQYWDAVKRAEIAPEIRPTCRACERFVPLGADMTVATMGESGLETKCTIFLNTDKAMGFIEGMEGKLAEEKLETEAIQQHKQKRKAEKNKLYDEIGLEKYGLSGMIDMFGKCIGCHGCSQVCPICYCEVCTFESRDLEPKPAEFERDLNKKRAIRVPPDTLFYHLGRLIHVAISCVGCGSCTDVCPVDIPVSSIFLKVRESVQELFDYVPGMDPEEAVPITKFETEELVEFED
ncbi:MAG: coenzyme F420 hydrogenase [candidate division Zixibacteria bacterium SM23_81]|nr:MAG: coenzyme F420 hydrogenase [candidate division Zixibacteria bacterium SM23_81]